MSASAPQEPLRTALQVVSAELRQIEGLGRKEWKAATPAERLALLQRVCDTVTIGHGLTSIAVTSEPLTGRRRSEYDQHRRAICLDGAVLVDSYLRKTAVKAVLRQSRRAAQVDARLAADAEQKLPVEQERLARLASHDPRSDHINVNEHDASSFSRGVLRRDARFRGAVAAPPGVIPAGIGAVSAGGAVLLAALALGVGSENIGSGSTTPHHHGTQHTSTQNGTVTTSSRGTTTTTKTPDVTVTSGGVTVTSGVTVTVTSGGTTTKNVRVPAPTDSQFIDDHGTNHVIDDHGDGHTIEDNGGIYAIIDHGGTYSISDNGGDYTINDNGGNYDISDNGGDYTINDNGGNYVVSDNGGNYTVNENGGTFTTDDNGGIYTFNYNGRSRTINGGGSTYVISEKNGQLTVRDVG